MNYERFLRDSRVKKVTPDLQQIEHQLKRARRDLVTAGSLLPVDLTWAFAIAYHAMIRASRALMYSKGYIPAGEQSHKTIIQFAGSTLGSEFSDLMGRFNRMRRRRHEFIYESRNRITRREAQTALETAERLVEEIISLVRKEHKDKRLFP